MYNKYRMVGYNIELTTKYVDIKDYKGIVKKGWIKINITKNNIFVYISKDIYRVYWIGKKKGPSAKLSLKFNDKKQMITINNSNKIIFHRPKDYETIKKKTIYYKHMKADENIVNFKRIE